MSQREARERFVDGRGVTCRWLVPRAPLVALAAALLALGVATPSPSAAQTVRGTLMDLDNDRPIPLGLVMMFTERGDSVTAVITDARGGFSITSPEPGSFVLLAAALGYRETPAGVFEIGTEGSVEVEYRIPAAPLPIDALVVSMDRPTVQHHLVRNGFVRRFQRGLGRFVTPYDIERSPARTTEQLFAGMAGVRVGSINVTRPGPGGGITLPRDDIGEVVQIQAAGGGWCTPTVYVDGVRSGYSTDSNQDAVRSLSMLTPRSDVEAIEVYRRPAEVPVEYDTGPFADCGVLVMWTKVGALRNTGSRTALNPDGPLPEVSEEGPPPVAGESIRMALAESTAIDVGLAPTWSGRFVDLQDRMLVAADTVTGRTVAVPMEGVQDLHVLRPRSRGHAFRRGAIAGAMVGAGVWAGLSVLCAWSDCNGSVENPWLPGLLTGAFAGFIVQSQGPGMHWVRGTLPRSEMPGPRGVELSLRVPTGAR